MGNCIKNTLDCENNNNNNEINEIKIIVEFKIKNKEAQEYFINKFINIHTQEEKTNFNIELVSYINNLIN
jgi:hypothetical protein